jgi:hypothetical protein
LFTIQLGSNQLDGSDSGTLKLTTDSFVLHPDYNPDTLENDIGLIEFRMPVTFTGGSNWFGENIILIFFYCRLCETSKFVTISCAF